MSPPAVGQIFHTLMRETLGYDRYFVQGGDWGAVITASMAYAHPESVAGLMA